MAQEVEAALGQIHILVNNAGCNVRKPALDVTWDDWNLVLDSNLRGSFFVAQAMARRYPEQLAVSVIACMPLVILYVFLSKYFVQGVAMTGLKS